MGSLFSTPKVKPDKAAQAAQIRQENVADSQLTDALQSNLRLDSRNALRAFGLQPASSSTGGYSGNGFNGNGYGGGGGNGGYRF